MRMGWRGFDICIKWRCRVCMALYIWKHQATCKRGARPYFLVSIFFSMLGQFELVKMIKRSIKNKKKTSTKKMDTHSLKSTLNIGFVRIGFVICDTIFLRIMLW